jgi:hypothetical protein
MEAIVEKTVQTVQLAAVEEAAQEVCARAYPNSSVRGRMVATSTRWINHAVTISKVSEEAEEVALTNQTMDSCLVIMVVEPKLTSPMTTQGSSSSEITKARNG